MRVIFSLIASIMLPMAAQAASPASPSTPAANPDTAIVVSQGAADISLRELDAFAQQIPDEKRGPVFDDPHRIEDILRGMLSQEQLAAEAHELGLDQDPLVKAQMKLAATKVLAEARVIALRKQIEANVPDLAQLARERYMANPDNYAVPASTNVKHILVGTKERSDAEAKALAEQIYTEVMKDPSTFDAKVEKYSDDPSKSRNQGVITGATSTRVVPEFREAAAALADIGDISAPVKTSFGYHILKLISRTPDRQRPFEDVRDELVQELRDEYVTKKVQAHLDQIRNTPLEADPDLVASLRTRYFDNAAKAPDPANANSTDE